MKQHYETTVTFFTEGLAFERSLVKPWFRVCRARQEPGNSQRAAPSGPLPMSHENHFQVFGNFTVPGKMDRVAAIITAIVCMNLSLTYNLSSLRVEILSLSLI